MSEAIETLDWQLRHGVKKLRFAPALERQFLEEHGKAALVQRMILLVVGAILVACSPFFDSVLLTPPGDYLATARRVQFGVILPALLLAFAFTADPRLRRWADAMGLLALVVVVAAWQYLRHIGAQHEFDVPVIMIGVVLAGTFALAGLFFWALAPVAALGLILFATLEIWTRGPTNETLYNILGLCLLALVTALSRYVQEYFQRANWLKQAGRDSAVDAQRRAAALRDPLTGLGNRRRQDEALRQACERAQAAGAKAALLFLDVDNFKNINESLGHSAGDRFLIEAAERLRQLAPPNAEICRCGGDEFTLVLGNLAGESAEHQVREIARGLLKGMAEPYTSTGDFVYLTVSAGIALFPDHGEDAEPLMASAEAAMYLAKRSGRNTFQLATSDLVDTSRRNLVLASQIRQGIAAAQFKPHYQPIVDLVSGQAVGAEALLRWQHPGRGLVLPDEFIPVAEESGAIEDLGACCLRQAYAQAAAWARQGRRLVVEVNLSAHQLRDGKLLGLLAELHAADPLPAGTLGFEITESATMENVEETQRILKRLRQQGYRLSIDDFGTGFSALGYLQKFPVHRIKIDRDFVARMVSSPQGPAIITATLALGRSLGLEVVAEGVETRQQMEQLRDLGCVLQQGHYFTAALPVHLLETWLTRPIEALAPQATPALARAG